MNTKMPEKRRFLRPPALPSRTVVLAARTVAGGARENTLLAMTLTACVFEMTINPVTTGET
jgi:hypothetical protein